MELRHLRYFVAVADLGSFTQAADALGIAQPTMSQQIRQLEDELRVPLFDRLGRKIRLTAAGVEFLRHARDILLSVDKARTEATDADGTEGGVLRIGAIQSFNAYLVPPIVAAFHAAYPKVGVVVLELPAPRIEDMLTDGELDLGIGFSPAGRDEITADPLFFEELGATVREGHSLAHRTIMPVRDLADVPLAFFARGMTTRRLIEAAFYEARITPMVALESNTVENLIRTVAASDLCALLPERAVVGRKGLSFVRLTAPTPRRAAAIMRCRGVHQTRAAEILTAMIREAVRREKEPDANT